MLQHHWTTKSSLEVRRHIGFDGAKIPNAEKYFTHVADEMNWRTGVRFSKALRSPVPISGTIIHTISCKL